MSLSISKILEEWNDDAKIDSFNLGEESLRIPRLHAKYLNYYNTLRRIRSELTKRYKVMKKEKYLYYSGKADVEVYKDKPFELKVLKSDLHEFTNSDDDIVTIEAKLDSIDAGLENVKSILKMLSDRNWQIKNAISYQQLMAGQ